MSDIKIRRGVALIATVACLLAYAAGYISAGYGFWWTAVAVFIVYGAVFRMIDK